MALPPTVPHETILVVEDNPLVLEIISLSLEHAGFTVLPAASPAEARQIEAEFAGTIHLLVSDVIMLHTSGSDLAEELKARRPELRVLLMSGSPEDPRVVSYKGHFLQKPFLPGDLLGKVNEVLRGEAGVGCGAGEE
jgi:two-component system, cell cycle sensor histidine kinase and response regulator CckA